MKRESWKKLWPFMRAEQETATDLRLVGELTILRSKSMDDAEADYSWRIDPKLAELDATRPVTLSYPEYVRYHRDDVNYPSPWSVRMAIDTLDGRHIGNCMYYDINTEKSQCELGIMIGDRKYWSKGYGTDVIKTALARIFTSTELDRVYLHTLTHNFRAQKSFAKAGFVHVREVKRDGYEFKLMEVLRADWEAAHLNEKLPTTVGNSSPEVSALSMAQTQTQADADPLLGS
ncbi:MAG TPA: N-acetyltransferase [Dehalococcoidia bacterium]|jgi:RimJ/RimL family protein N-acetyltransferase|nr:N-acetyltransferase [Dehalococcoidia bacterium]HIK89920.1 N-acetyltransferase [Dehalococcoidia bacterium]